MKKLPAVFDSKQFSLYSSNHFCYIFPFLRILAISVVSVQATENEQSAPFNRMMRAFVSLHLFIAHNK